MFEPERQLIEQVSVDAGIPADTLIALLKLQRDFPNLSARGVKRRLAERVEEVITAGMGTKT